MGKRHFCTVLITLRQKLQPTYGHLELKTLLAKTIAANLGLHSGESLVRKLMVLLSCLHCVF